MYDLVVTPGRPRVSTDLYGLLNHGFNKVWEKEFILDERQGAAEDESEERLATLHVQRNKVCEYNGRAIFGSADNNEGYAPTMRATSGPKYSKASAE